MPAIEYFYSAHSSYAYLGSARLAEIAADKGSDIVHRPVDLNQIVAAAGSTAFSERSDAYRAYFFVRELQRWSEYRNVPMIASPEHHHNDTTLANCMIISCAETGGNTQGLSHGLLQAHWRDDADLADRATLLDIATITGCDATSLLQHAGTAEIQEIYQRNTRAAIERSVFGSPTYIVDGDMFYGQDRLELLERALEHPFATGWSVQQ